jgi:glycosyltransferase involved in cell wall biosynthesis
VRAPVAAGARPAVAESFTAFFCGSFVPLQGVPYILDAAALAPDIRFRIVGDGVDGPALEREVARRGMDNVKLERRFVPKPELERRLAEADAVLGVFGSTPKTARVIPCKVYDGLAAGQAVVTGDSPAARELLRDGDNALLVDRRDPRALADALRRLRDEPGLADRLCDGARRTARERFAPAVLGRSLRGALEELVR